MEYAALLIQIRMIADAMGDTRSLVAIAAQFEREATELLAMLDASIQKRAHCRNQINRSQL